MKFRQGAVTFLQLYICLQFISNTERIVNAMKRFLSSFNENHQTLHKYPHLSPNQILHI